MTSEVHLRDVFEVEDGVLKSLDLSKLFFPDHGELRDVASTEWFSDHDVRLIRLQPKPANLSGRLRELLTPPQTTTRAIVPRGELTLIRGGRSQPDGSGRARISLRSFPRTKTESAPKIRPLPRSMYSVARSPDPSFLGGLLGGALKGRSRLEIELPFGVPRFVSAVTLKVMLGADEEETLFKKNGKRWEICSDSFEVDLKDWTQVFRLGPVQIYS